MSLSHHPNIVRNGLVAYFDAANPKSYPAGQDPYVNNVSLMLDGESLIDQSANARTFTASVGASVSTANKKFGNSSIYCTGSTSYIYNSSFNSSFGGDFTIEFWAYHNSFASINQLILIGNESSARRAIYINSSGKVVLDLYGTGAVGTFNTTISTGTWNHYVLTRSGTTVKLFVNGTLDSVTVSVSGTFGNANGVYIGSDSNGINSSNAYFDDIRITSGISRYTASFTPPSAPLSLPGRIADLTTNKVIGTLTNGLTFDSSNGGSILANATNQYFTGSINSSVWTSNISMCAWFKHTGYGNLWEAIFSANTSASFYGSPIMTFNGTSVATRNQIGINNAGVSPNGVFLDLTANHLNKWIYCVITISGTTATIYAFQDGVLSSNSGTLPYTLTRTSTGYYVFRHYDFLTTQIFQGNIAKVELYNRALTATEILQNYNATKSRYGY